MKRFVYALLIAFFALCALVNCSVPIGSIELPDNHDEIESMWLIPHRQLYQIDDKFYRDKDFQLFIIEKGGRVVEIKPDLEKKPKAETFPDLGAKVSLTYNIEQPNEKTEVMDNATHSFTIIGTHKITVSYANKSSYYMIEVISSNNGSTLGGDDGIGIIWLE